MALAPSTANWHWKNKDVTRWGREWFERELTTLTVSNDASESVSIKTVTNVEGDIELGQRKSKCASDCMNREFKAYLNVQKQRLITIYEVRIEMKWEGTASDGTQVQGKVTVPEVSHEITVDGLSNYEVGVKISIHSLCLLSVDSINGR
jgi:activator of HSP90 ATPase